MSDQLVIIQSTTDSSESAKSWAQYLVSNRLAACVQIEGPIHSVFEWKGELLEQTEWRVQIKTLASHATEVTKWLASNHNYDLPEIVQYSVDFVSPNYLNWVGDQLKPL